ncbi:MerR family transcriptional regulator [Streptomyces sp. NPDC001933]|uniref:MerR family transcriptional regulator n=1 Tax=Streptomyces sp. NPDC001933 TaxID=3364626 RepID=UPI00367CDA89
MTRHSAKGKITVSTQLAAMAAGVTEATIRKWASRGKLTRYGSPGRAEYAIDELLDLAVARSRPSKTKGAAGPPEAG